MTKKTYPHTCTFCKGKGTNTAVDAINPDGSVVNPRTAPCMVCDGKKVITADMEDQTEVGGSERSYVPTLASITKRHREATGGWWELEDDGDTFVISSGAAELARVGHSDVAPENAQFLANAYTDMGHLLTLVGKLTKTNRKLRKALKPTKVP